LISSRWYYSSLMDIERLKAAVVDQRDTALQGVKDIFSQVRNDMEADSGLLLAQGEALVRKARNINGMLGVIDERIDALVAELEHAGVDLTGIIEPKEEIKESEAQPAELQEEDEAARGPLREASEPRSEEREEKKRRGIERIREQMGNFNVFMTGDPEFDDRLRKPINAIKGVRSDMTEGFQQKFGHHLPNIADFLSHTPEEIEKADFWGPKRVNKFLEQVYALGLMPREKFPVDEFIEEHAETFSEEAVGVLKQAEAEALARNQKYIGTEHLMLALIKNEDSIVSDVIKSIGVEDLDKIRKAIDFIIGKGEEFIGQVEEITGGSKIVLELAVDEARQEGKDRVSPEHILYGIVREGEGVAGGVLASLGMSNRIFEEMYGKRQKKD